MYQFRKVAEDNGMTVMKDGESNKRYSSLGEEFRNEWVEELESRYEGHSPLVFDVSIGLDNALVHALLQEGEIIGTNLSARDAIAAFCSRYDSMPEGFVTVHFECKGIAPLAV